MSMNHQGCVDWVCIFMHTQHMCVCALRFLVVNYFTSLGPHPFKIKLITPFPLASEDSRPEPSLLPPHLGLYLTDNLLLSIFTISPFSAFFPFSNCCRSIILLSTHHPHSGQDFLLLPGFWESLWHLRDEGRLPRSEAGVASLLAMLSLTGTIHSHTPTINLLVTSKF